MEINIGYIVKQIDGIAPIVIDEGKELSVKDICINALLTASSNDNGDAKFNDYELFKRIKESGDVVDLSAEEVVRIKTKVGEIYQPLVVGQVYEILEGKLK